MPGLRLPGLPPGFPLEDGALHETTTKVMRAMIASKRYFFMTMPALGFTPYYKFPGSFSFQYDTPL